MPQIPPISDAYIDEIIKSGGPYVESINKTQGVKLRELIKVLRDYFEQEIPKTTSALTNDSNFVSEAVLAGIPEENGQKKPFIIRPLAEWDPEEVIGTGNEPVHSMLVATEIINNKYTVTQLKISDGVTAFKDLKNLVVDGLTVVATGLTSTAGTPTSSDTVVTILGKFKNFFDNAGTTIRDTVLTGLLTTTNTAITATDTVLGALGKLQTQITAKLTGTLATDAETQISAAVTEDNKVVSRLKLFNWWTWIKTQAQTFTAKVTFTAAPRFNSAAASTYLKVDANKDLTAVTAIPAADVTESTTKRFITDTERTTWAAKQDALAIATDAEMQTGTNNTKYVTPSRTTNWWTWIRTQSSMWTLSFLAGAGNRVVQVNSNGEISTPNVIMDGFVTDPVVISAITDATYNSANGYTANIASNGIFFYQGQMYKSGQYLYIAILDNTSFRVSGG